MATGSGSLSSLREFNRLRIVDFLRTNGTASRAELARRTGLSRSTVSTLVADLQRRGLVVERAGQFAGEGQPGRPAALLELDPKAAAAVGIDFDHDKVRVAVSDLSRSVLAEATATHDVDHDAQGALDLAARLIEQTLDETGLERDRLLGVGVALAGPIDHDRGALHPSDVLPGWAHVDAAREIEERVDLPAYVDNDANLGALAEVTLGAGRNARFAAYLSISSGIGAGIVVDGRPYHGHRGTAGEIGHVVVDPQGPICRCGNRGCLETLASGPALLKLVQDSRDTQLTVREMIELARDGDAGCTRAIADAGQVIGRVVAGLVNLFSPEMVVIGGDLGEAGDLLLDPLREAVRRNALPAAAEELRVVAGELGERANLLGALALVLMQSEHEVAARVAGSAAA
ncbi:MAG TPA: ROK family transcriptional regulator [Thermoleophilaceae bacterium]|jgi:predicted NBD/HSP70 family sugar kinase|nr:ROK family transcriptional regulator [Thermoleophilaceae bacterium]